MVKIGDKVRFLSSVGGGIVTKIVGNTAYVEDEDGFETPSLIKELVVVGEGTIPNFSANTKVEFEKQTKAKEVITPAEPEYIPEETPNGDKLNVVLAYEPVDIQKLSVTTFDTYLVNDSNYYLSFTYLTRDDDNKTWICRNNDTVEPNTQLYLGELDRENIGKIGHIIFQIIAYKKNKDFEVKPAISVERRIDVTKFFKLHCFAENVYFDAKVLAYDIVKDDIPYKMSEKNGSDLKKAIAEKKAGEREIRKPIVKKTPKALRQGETLVVDLHIHELVDTTAGLSPADMLNLQIDHFRKIMDENVKHHGQKIVFIHGKGEGVLRNALLKELNYRYKGNDVQDASFREYGFGATQVTIR